MNSFKKWRVSVASPENKATIEEFLHQNSGSVGLNTAIEFINPLLEKGMDNVTLLTDDGLYVFLGLDD